MRHQLSRLRTSWPDQRRERDVERARIGGECSERRAESVDVVLGGAGHHRGHRGGDLVVVARREASAARGEERAVAIDHRHGLRAAEQLDARLGLGPRDHPREQRGQLGVGDRGEAIGRDVSEARRGDPVGIVDGAGEHRPGLVAIEVVPQRAQERDAHVAMERARGQLVEARHAERGPQLAEQAHDLLADGDLAHRRVGEQVDRARRRHLEQRAAQAIDREPRAGVVEARQERRHALASVAAGQHADRLLLHRGALVAGERTQRALIAPLERGQRRDRRQHGRGVALAIGDELRERGGVALDLRGRPAMAAAAELEQPGGGAGGADAGDALAADQRCQQLLAVAVRPVPDLAQPEQAGVGAQQAGDRGVEGGGGAAIQHGRRLDVVPQRSDVQDVDQLVRQGRGQPRSTTGAMTGLSAGEEAVALRERDDRRPPLLPARVDHEVGQRRFVQRGCIRRDHRGELVQLRRVAHGEARAGHQLGEAGHARQVHTEAVGQRREPREALLRRPGRRDLEQRRRRRADLVGRQPRAEPRVEELPALLDHRRELGRGPRGVDAEQAHHDPLAGGVGRAAAVRGVEHRRAPICCHRRQVLGAPHPARPAGQGLEHRLAHRVLLERAGDHQRQRQRRQLAVVGVDARHRQQLAQRQDPAPRRRGGRGAA
jgi:hypothetical protein